ncbi:MAG: zf-HC2 domain-containing protein [Gemmatimonadaceae bacterium]
MTVPDIGCDRCEAMASAYVDGELDPRETVELECHLAACSACRDLMHDIKTMSDSARSLPLLSPSRDLWVGIDARIATPVVSLDQRPRHAWPVRRLAAVAAIALVAVSSGLTYLVTRSLSPTTPVRVGSIGKVQVPEPAAIAATGNSAPDKPAPSPTVGRDVPPTPIGDALRGALVSATRSRGATERLLAPEIADLQQVLNARRDELDPATVKVVEDNLALIDAAVGQAKAALRRDPASGFLTDLLDGALQKKVELLRTAALLPSRS